MEEWRKIPGCAPYYEVSSLGNARTIEHEVPYRFVGMTAVRKGRQLKPYDSGRYLQVSVGKQTRSLHRLILAAFAGPAPSPKAECRHLNGNPYDNRVENLAWGSARENQMDRHDHGTACRGEDGYQATITEADVRLIMELRGKGLGPAAIRDATGCSLSRVKSVIYGMSWCWLTGIRAPSKRNQN